MTKVVNSNAIISFRGIILYGMVVGKLPFSTHYTDQYRRQKLLAQIEKGLTVEVHHKEMIAHALSLGQNAFI